MFKYSRYLIDEIEKEIVLHIDKDMYSRDVDKEVRKYAQEMLFNIISMPIFTVFTIGGWKLGYSISTFLAWIVFVFYSINFIGGVLSPSNKVSLRLVVLYMFHYFFINTIGERKLELRAFVDANFPNRTGRRLYSEQKTKSKQTTEDSDFDKLVNNYVENPEKLMEDIYNRDEQSLRRFLLQVKHDDKNNFKYFIAWSLIIPRKVSLDGLKFLLSANRIDKKSYELLRGKNFTKEVIENGFDGMFNKYKEGQFKRWFQINYNPSSYIILIDILKEYKGEFNVYTTLTEAFDYALEYEENFKSNLFNLDQFKHLPKLKRLEKARLGAYSFEIIKDIEELNKWGKNLKHCIKGYFKKCYDGNCYLIGVYSSEGGSRNPYANIELDKNLNIVQIKGKQNSQVQMHDIIRDYVSNILKIDQ